MTRGDTLLPVAAVSVSAVLWGVWWIPLRWLDRSGLPGDWASLAISCAAFAVVAPFLWARRDRLRRGGRPVLLSGVLFGVMMVFWNHALLTGEVVRVVLLFYLAPVWSTLLALLVLNLAISPLRLLTIVLGLAGAATILGFEGGLPIPRGEGEWMGLIAGALFALSATFSRTAEGSGGFESAALSFGAAALTAAVLVLWAPAPPTGATMLQAVPLAAVVAIFALLPGTWLILWGATKLDPGRVSILLLLEVVASAISATLWAGESFGWQEAGGCLFILLAGLTEAMQPRVQPAD